LPEEKIKMPSHAVMPDEIIRWKNTEKLAALLWTYPGMNKPDFIFSLIFAFCISLWDPACDDREK
jgi:hypothetical protein